VRELLLQELVQPSVLEQELGLVRELVQELLEQSRRRNLRLR
jgi:hypothetical protein